MLREARPRLGKQVQDYVKDLLLDGKQAADAPIQVDAIAKDLGVSRQPVMEAVRRLAQEGFINIVPQVGSFPRRYKTSEILDFFELFANNECLIARLACQRAERTDIVRLRAISREIGHLEQQEQNEFEMARHYRALNRRFHSEMRAMTKSSAITEAVERMGDQSDFFIAISNAPIFFKRLQVAHGEHEALIAAIEAKDEDAAVSIMREHVLAISERIGRQAEA